MQQFYASKYVGVANLTFDDAGALTASTGKSVPLGTYYDDSGEEMFGADVYTHAPLALLSMYECCQYPTADMWMIWCVLFSG
ncbi:MAG: hypothetical protein HC767_13220 [Akkermansiaceae bacterium]|nr:hypothetical protein [Akkermansiaceae bacterium]